MRTANKLVEDQIILFLKANPEEFKELMLSTERLIRDSHNEILEYLKQNCSDNKVIDELKEKLEL